MMWETKAKKNTQALRVEYYDFGTLYATFTANPLHSLHYNEKEKIRTIISASSDWTEMVSLAQDKPCHFQITSFGCDPYNN